MTKRKPKRTTALAWVVTSLLAMGSASGASGGDGPRFSRTEVSVEVPSVTLIDQRGHEVTLQQLLRPEHPVFVEFIFATCTTICPILSAGYASLQRRVDDPDDVTLISITIDPEHDGPEQLREYLARYQAQPGWEFVTGTRTDIDTVMRAFDAFIPDKMSHRPLIFVRSPKDGKWVRLQGFPGSKDLMAEYRRALGELE